MLTRVEVRTRQGTLLNFPLDDVLNGYIIDEIEGLDPVKATLVTSSYANEDGEQEHGWRREARDIKLKITLEPDYVTNTVKSLRDRLYAYFMTGRQVYLRFIHDDEENDLVVDIVGRVETCDSPIFVKEPQVHVSVHCYQPDFVVPEAIVLTAATVETAIDPVSGLSLATEVNYPGTVDTGFVLTIEIDRTESSFSIFNVGEDEIIRQLDFSAPLVAGDTVRISTVPGAKGATLTRAGTESSVLYGVDPTSNWIRFEQGLNKFRVQASGLPIPYSLQYLTRYGGL